MKKKIINTFLLFIIIFSSYSYGFYSGLPIWQDTSTLETSADTSQNFITLESESAILIEQSTRSSSF